MWTIFAELVEGLSRAQRRLEDQRGTEINIELPDFLKDKENQPSSVSQQKEPKSDTRFYVDDETSTHAKQQVHTTSATNHSRSDFHAMYENRSIIEQNQKECSSQKNNLRVTPTSEVSSMQTTPSKSSNCTSMQTTPSKGSNGTVLENPEKPSDPPPLPPKPKIMPIKPQNWGQLNGFSKFKDMNTANKNQTMFLEQPSSSFV